MTRDTVASLGAIPEALTEFLQLFRRPVQSELAACMSVVRTSLAQADAYQQVPGRDPKAC